MTSAATTPTRTLSPSPRFDSVAERRWTEWEAATLIWCQRGNYSPRYLSDLCRDHRQWLATLRSRGIPMSAIRRLTLDDPREVRAVLELRADDYVQRILRRSTKELR